MFDSIHNVLFSIRQWPLLITGLFGRLHSVGHQPFTTSDILLCSYIHTPVPTPVATPISTTTSSCSRLATSVRMCSRYSYIHVHDYVGLYIYPPYLPTCRPISVPSTLEPSICVYIWFWVILNQYVSSSRYQYYIYLHVGVYPYPQYIHTAGCV